MVSKNVHSNKISSLFTPENIEIYSEKIELDALIQKLLENLALNYGIGNIHTIYSNFLTNIEIIKSSKKIISDCFLYHVRISSSENVRIAIAVLKNGIKQSVTNNNEKISVVIILVSPKEKPDLYLKTAKSFKELFNKINISSILKYEKSEEIWNIIDQSNISLPEIIYAEDLMEEVEVYLNESNNLKDAIDKFVNTDYLNIPVIDLEGNLVGEVTSRELMEVCLPRYILWMDDINPIINFEPFRNMLENDENTWLAEIMNHDCPVIQKNDPFIYAAITMTKKSISHVYVLDDNKLVGVISMKLFLDKILRD